MEFTAKQIASFIGGKVEGDENATVHTFAGASSYGTVIIFPHNRALHPEGFLHPRGVAGSGLPPLPNIPHCCLP